MYETSCKFAVTKIALSCCDKNRHVYTGLKIIYELDSAHVKCSV